jgi:hypothetical protein
VDVVAHKVPFLNPAFPPPGQTPEYFTKLLPQLSVQNLAAMVGKNNVVLALPPRSAQARQASVWRTGSGSPPRALERKTASTTAIVWIASSTLMESVESVPSAQRIRLAMVPIKAWGNQVH